MKLLLTLIVFASSFTLYAQPMFRVESERAIQELKDSSTKAMVNERERSSSIIKSQGKHFLAVIEGDGVNVASLKFEGKTPLFTFSATEKYAYALFTGDTTSNSSGSLYQVLQYSPLRKISLESVKAYKTKKVEIIKSSDSERVVDLILLKDKDSQIEGTSIYQCNELISPTKKSNDSDIFYTNLKLKEGCELTLKSKHDGSISLFYIVDNFTNVIRGEIVKIKGDIRRLKGRISKASKDDEVKNLKEKLNSKRAKLSSYERFLRQNL